MTRISTTYGPFLPSQRFDSNASPQEFYFIPGSDFFGGMLSDLRFPESVGHPAGAAVVSCAGDGKVEVYDMFHSPGTYMPPTGFVAMTRHVCTCHY